MRFGAPVRGMRPLGSSESLRCVGRTVTQREVSRHGFRISIVAARRLRRAGAAGSRARLPLRGRSSRRLPDRRGGQVHGQAARRSRPAASWASRSIPNGALGHREGHDRAAEDRRARHDAHQRRAAEQHRARDDRAGAAVPVPLRGAHARGARRPGRRRDPGRDGSAGLGRPGVLRQRRPLDLHREEAGQDAWPTSRA